MGGIRLLSLAGLLCMSIVPAQAQTLYSADFESGIPAGFTGAGFINASGGYADYGFGNSMLRNWSGVDQAITLTLNLAQAANNVTLTFDAAFIDSWDGRSGGCCNPDVLRVALDGSTVLEHSINNVWGYVAGFGGTAVSDPIPAGSVLFVDVGAALNLAGEWNGSSGYDSGIRFALNLGNLGAGTHTITWAPSGGGWQAGQDESFAIDNVAIAAVPEPSSWLLMLAGLIVTGTLAVRRAKAPATRG